MSMKHNMVCVYFFKNMHTIYAHTYMGTLQLFTSFHKWKDSITLKFFYFEMNTDIYTMVKKCIIYVLYTIFYGVNGDLVYYAVCAWNLMAFLFQKGIYIFYDYTLFFCTQHVCYLLCNVYSVLCMWEHRYVWHTTPLLLCIFYVIVHAT